MRRNSQEKFSTRKHLFQTYRTFNQTIYPVEFFSLPLPMFSRRLLACSPSRYSCAIQYGQSVFFSGELCMSWVLGHFRPNQTTC